jgi:tetratricopeptide (TPR) repeat protein
MRIAILLLSACLTACAALPTAGPGDDRVAFDSHMLLGDLALQRQQFARATEHYLDAALISDDPSLAERTARMASELGMTETGLRAVTRWRALDDDDERVHYFSGLFEFRSGRVERAIGEFTALIERLGDASIGLALVMEALGSEPDTAGSTQVMSALTRRFPGTLEGHYALARLALRSGDFGLALENARAAVDLEPGWVEAQLLYARTLLVAGRTAESLAIASRLAEEHADVETRLQHAELLVSAGQPREAETRLNEILEISPGLPEAIRALAYLALTENELSTAERHFNELRTDPRYRDEAFFYLGRIAETEERFLQATRSYQRVTQGPHVVEAQLRTARVLFEEMGDREGALRHLEEFGNANPRFSSELLIARGQLLLQMGQPGEAMRLVSDALAASPQDESLQNVHAQMFVILASDALERRELGEAERIVNEGLASYPTHRSLRYSLALVYERQRRARNSVRLLRGLVDEDPGNPAYLNALGYVLTDGLDRHDEARGYIQQALALDPDNPAIIDSMGWVLYRLGDAETALDYLERAYRLERDSEIAAHLVEVLWTLGQRERALELLEAAVVLDPDNPQLEDIGRRISR